MRSAILFSVALLGVPASALAQMPPPRMNNGDMAMRSDEAVDGPGSGLQLELNVFREAGFYTTDSLFSVVGSVIGSNEEGSSFVGNLLGTLQPLVSIGYQWDQNALLLGIGVTSIGVPSGSTGSPTFLFGVTPTYRRYLNPLRTGQLSTFIEGGVTISLVAVGSTGMGANDGYLSWGLGLEATGGAEWLFVKNFGLFGKAGLTYGHVNLVSGSMEPNTNYDAIGLVGDVGLAVHL